MSDTLLPYGRQDITDEDVAAVTAALRSKFLTTGPRVAEFEDVFAAYVEAPYAVAVANGTAALHLACLALDVGPGDTVLAPTMSFAASTNGAAYAGADIEFMDCDPETGLVTPEAFVEAADRAVQKGKKPKVAVVVHLNGEHADLAGIFQEAQKRSIELIEDSCHALGTTYLDHDGKRCMVGSCRYSTFSTYSTHPVKTVTTGEGGLITTQNAKLAKRLRDLRNHGIERDPDSFINQSMAFDPEGNPNPWYYEMQSLGYNYRLTDIACALGVSQMSRMEENAKRRRELKILYDEAFAKTNLPVTPVKGQDDVDAVRHLYPVHVDFDALGIERGRFMRELNAHGIGTQVHYIPTHLQPYYQSKHKDVSLPGAIEYYRTIVSLPFYPQLEDSDVNRVIDAIGQVLGNK